MNPFFKSDVRMGALQEAAQLLRKQKDGATDEVLKHDGAAAVLKTAAARISGLHQVLESMRDKDLGDMEAADQITAAKFAKGFLQQAVSILQKLQGGEEVARIKSLGKAQGHDGSIQVLEKLWAQAQIEKNELEQALARGDLEIETDDDDGEVVSSAVGQAGVRPGMSLADRRRAEDAAEDAAEAEALEQKKVATSAPKPKPKAGGKKKAAPKQPASKKSAPKKK